MMLLRMSLKGSEMKRKFFDVFGKLKSEDRGGYVLENCDIERLSTTKDHSVLKVYLRSDALIPKRAIWNLEKKIKDVYFHEKPVNITIIESFNLAASSYSPKELYEAYKDSILEEIHRYSPVLFQVLDRSRAEFDGNHMTIVIEDELLCHEVDNELVRLLSRILCERLGLDLIIDTRYTKASSHDKRRKENEARLRLEIEQIEKDAEKRQEKEAIKKADAPLEKHPDAAGFDKENKEQPFTRKVYLTRSRDPMMIYGRDFDDPLTAIKEISGDMGQVTVHGQVFMAEDRELRNGKILYMFALTDFSDSIKVKMFLGKDQFDLLKARVKNGSFIQLNGLASMDAFDHEVSISMVKGIREISDFRVRRMDNAAEKRVELHCHTKMSDMDGVSDVSDIIKQAISWGHKAIAITDHGVVQSFPDAAAAAKGHDDFKIIYGCEVYLVDDTKTIVTNPKDQTLSDTFVVFDIETTGLSAEKCDIIEIGAVKIEDGKITDRFSEFVNPKKPIPFRITELTSITDAQVSSAPGIDVILPKFREFCGNSVLVAHNADFDCSFIHNKARDLGIDWDFTFADTMPMSRFLIPGIGKLTLDNVAKNLDVPLGHHHRAVDDAECTALIFLELVKKLYMRDIHTLRELNECGRMDAEAIMKAKPYHCILLAKNDIGRINLYRLVSLSHLKYFRRTPRIPKSEIEKHREGLIIGSACEAGELYQAVMLGKEKEIIQRIVQFYDYLEIQPNGNNHFLIEDDKSPVDSEEGLCQINRRIVALGEEFDKPVCATCDVHFLNPCDEVYRRIIQSEKEMKGYDHQPPLYLHTTDEMLKEFSYLGEKKAREVVIENPGRIADMVDVIAPTRPDKCPPVIEDSDETLRTICYTKAHEMYGPTLPEQVSARLERELNSIISNGYAVMYIIAQKLVWKSNEDGYLVGSRGSVGSSFVATMAGITEVNPLPAHYLCPKCHYVDFDSPEVKAYAGNAGCDMPDKICPVCGHELSKQGFDIPFETFLGFKGNKEPDIDLNFSGDYQSKAHAYTAVIFGDGQTFKAGTIGTLADKTAYGYLMHYCETHNISKRRCEMDRLVQGCVGVRRTTGQHPGGIVVLPVGEEIDTFTPVQHPANDMSSDIITTHFDYHKIDGNLLKLDILGHDDPTMIRRLEDITGLDATRIPLDDKMVMSLFKDTSALGVSPDDLWKHTEMGTLGIPEFGTDFAMGMLKEAKPKMFSDLIRISGLSHGTDVWLGNAQDLIKSGTADLSTCICCRDDIMIYLINKGLDPEESFTIMERVRKGKVAKHQVAEWDDWVADMKAHGVPDWYKGSCEKIKYMFPKAHAAAYVMMAWRVAYFKVYYPLAYYAAFFSIRATDFSYEKMCRGEEVLKHYLKELDDKGKSNEKLTAKDKGSERDMRIVQEMYARGFDFLPLDLYRSDARYFKIVDGKLLPPFSSIDGMGEAAAESLAIAAAQKPFLSIDDIKERGHVSQTVCDTMKNLGLLKGLPESNQLSFFDML